VGGVEKYIYVCMYVCTYTWWMEPV
jgi:hypothetical protein